jgi:hypothetical protein
MNARLAVFDRTWTVPPVAEVAITSYADGDQTDVQKPTILLIGNMLYVAYVSGPMGNIASAQVSVARFRIWPDRRPHRLLRRVSGDD